jgi:hypothetical protein
VRLLTPCPTTHELPLHVESLGFVCLPYVLLKCTHTNWGLSPRPTLLQRTTHSSDYLGTNAKRKVHNTFARAFARHHPEWRYVCVDGALFHRLLESMVLVPQAEKSGGPKAASQSMRRWPPFRCFGDVCQWSIEVATCQACNCCGEG